MTDGFIFFYANLWLLNSYLLHIPQKICSPLCIYLFKFFPLMVVLWLAIFRQASVALNVWQPEVVRGSQRQLVEQSVVAIESRVHSLEMALKLCKQQIASLNKAYVSSRQYLQVTSCKLLCKNLLVIYVICVGSHGREMRSEDLIKQRKNWHLWGITPCKTIS